MLLPTLTRKLVGHKLQPKEVDKNIEVTDWEALSTLIRKLQDQFKETGKIEEKSISPSKERA